MSARRPWAWPLVPVYRAALAVKDVLRRTSTAPKRLAWPVVSVGSLSAGGAGKTPVVIALAKLLQERGWSVDVLSRGYGRQGRGVERVAGGDAERFGDEPVLIASAAEVPVWVAAERFAAGVQAEREAATGGVHLLDDGFQHRQLARQVEVVLVTAEDLEDTLLPAGNLREPWSALGRAEVVVVREEEMDTVSAAVWPRLREGAQMWVVRRRLVFPGLFSSASCAGMHVFGAGLRPVAFCALARPEGFARMLLDAGCGVVETVAYRDHHRYTAADVEQVMRVAKRCGATGLVTTEKDAVKLSPAMRARLESMGPLLVAGLVAEFVDREAVAAALEARLTASAEGKR